MNPSVAGFLNTLLIGAAVLFVLYRRFRRNFGRQNLRPTRMWIRVAILGLVCVLLALSPFLGEMSFVAMGIGAVIGIGLGIYAASQTKFELSAAGRFYTPNGYIGLGVTALFLGRLIYRMTVVYPVLHHAAQQAAQNSQFQNSPFAAYQHSPVTLGIYFLLASYYICYYIAIMIKSRQFAQTSSSQAETP